MLLDIAGIAVAAAAASVRRWVDAATWTAIGLGLAFTAVNVQVFAAAGAPAWSPSWVVAWLLDPMVSVLLLGISVWIRLQLSESPAFKKMKEEGTQSKAPLKEAFGNWKNGKIALIALLGLTAAVFVAIGVNELIKALQPVLGG